MKILNTAKKTKEKKKTGSFADFFLHASEKEKIRVFKDVAKRANEDQRILVEKVNKLQQKTT